MRPLAIAALIAGGLLRLAALSIAVPAVDDSWRAWSYHAATEGPWNLYGPKGHTVTFGEIAVPVVYPPLALDELAIVGRVHMALNRGRFENDLALTRTIKGTIVLLDAALAATIFFVVRRAGGAARGWWAAMGYWLNPAVLMITTLGYVDVLVAIPAVGALIAAVRGRPWLSGALFSAAVLTKPQGLFVGPVAVVALWNAGAMGEAKARVRAGIAASALTAAIVAAPVAAAGRTFEMLRSIAVLAGHNMLSALAYNFWWIVSYILTAASAQHAGAAHPFAVEPDIVTHAAAAARGLPPPRLIAVALLAVPVCWALYAAARARDVGLQAALAAFMVVTYFTLSVQVHENHFFLAIPLLAIAASLRPALAPIFAALSVSFALNLYVAFGLDGEGPWPSLTQLAGIDTSALLAIVECALFGWFAARLVRECASPADGHGRAASFASEAGA